MALIINTLTTICFIILNKHTQTISQHKIAIYDSSSFLVLELSLSADVNTVYIKSFEGENF